MEVYVGDRLKGVVRPWETLHCSFEFCVDPPPPPPPPPRPWCGKLLLGCAELSSPLGNSVLRVLVHSMMRWLLFVSVCWGDWVWVGGGP